MEKGKDKENSSTHRFKISYIDPVLDSIQTVVEFHGMRGEIQFAIVPKWVTSKYFFFLISVEAV